MDCTITFSRIVLLRENIPPIPMARIEIGMAASIPWPILRAR